MWMERLAALAQDNSALVKQVLRGFLLLNQGELTRRLLLQPSLPGLLSGLFEQQEFPKWELMGEFTQGIQQSIHECLTLTHIRDHYATALLQQSNPSSNNNGLDEVSNDQVVSHLNSHSVDAAWATLSVLQRQSQMALLDRLNAARVDPWMFVLQKFQSYNLPTDDDAGLGFVREFMTLSMSAVSMEHSPGLLWDPPRDALKLLIVKGAWDILLRLSQSNISGLRRWLTEDQESLGNLVEAFNGASCQEDLANLNSLILSLTGPITNHPAWNYAGNTIVQSEQSRILDDFLGILYSTISINSIKTEPAVRLLAPLTSNHGEQQPFKMTHIRHGMCIGLLVHFLCHHRYRIKYLLLRTNILQTVFGYLVKIDQLNNLSTTINDGNAVVETNNSSALIMIAANGAVKVMLSMVATRDDFYFRFLVKHGLLKPLVHAVSLFATDDKKNSIPKGALEGQLFELFFAIARLSPHVETIRKAILQELIAKKLINNDDDDLSGTNTLWSECFKRLASNNASAPVASANVEATRETKEMAMDVEVIAQVNNAKQTNATLLATRSRSYSPPPPPPPPSHS